MNRALLNLKLLNAFIRPATRSAMLMDIKELDSDYQSKGEASSRRVESGSAASRYPGQLNQTGAFSNIQHNFWVKENLNSSANLQRHR
jgi:hypothetical protein